MYLMFMGPYEEGGDWSDAGIVGIDRFVRRVYHLIIDNKEYLVGKLTNDRIIFDTLKSDARNLYRKCHQTIKKVSADTESFQFNTAIAALMELLNDISRYTQNIHQRTELEKAVFVHTIRNFIILVAPFAPHLAEEVWEICGENESIFTSANWPQYDAGALNVEEVTIVAQINGRIRAKFVVSTGTNENILKEMTLSNENIKRYLDGKQILKTIIVKDKLVNLVVR
jgi:leucyl-tRNA synthetase